MKEAENNEEEAAREKFMAIASRSITASAY